MKRYEEALAAYDRALAISPKLVWGRHNRSMLLECMVALVRAMSTNPKLGEARRAVKLARRAVELAPTKGLCWNMFGVALCRTGKWTEAIDALKRSIALRSGGDATDWFFVAMAFRHLDHNDRARRAYKRAITWMDKHNPDDAELKRFRAEAEAVLRIPAEETNSEAQR